MSYTPTEWSNGDVITAEKLNKIEAGVEASDTAPLICTATRTITNLGFAKATLDKTFREIGTALLNGRIIIIKEMQYDNIYDDQSQQLLSIEPNGRYIMGTILSGGVDFDAPEIRFDVYGPSDFSGNDTFATAYTSATSDDDLDTYPEEYWD